MTTSAATQALPIEFGGPAVLTDGKDRIVQPRGRRLWPTRVETAIRGCSGVRDAAVFVRAGENALQPSIVAYVELQPGVRGLLPRHVKSIASRALPAFLVPSTVVVMAVLPRLPNLRIDRAALIRAVADRTRDDAGGRQNSVLGGVVRVMEEILAVSGATPDDNLMSLGGDSLQALHVILALEDRFELTIPSGVFEYSNTIRELAAWISARAPKSVLAGLSRP